MLSDDFIFHSCTLHIYNKIFEQAYISLNFRLFLVRIPFLLKWVHFRSVFHRTLPTASSVMDGGIYAFTIALLFFTKKVSHLFLQALGLSKDICHFSNGQFWWSYLIILSKPLSLQYYFSYACRWLLLNTSSMISSLIFLNKFFLHLDAIALINVYIQWNSL